jgi:hypothetical protein
LRRPGEKPGPERERNCAHRGAVLCGFGTEADAFCDSHARGYGSGLSPGRPAESLCSASPHARICDQKQLAVPAASIDSFPNHKCSPLVTNNTTWEPKVQDTVTATTQPQQTAKPRAGGPLAGVRIVEFAGLGPGPFASMMLSDMGADVVTLARGEQRQGLRGAVMMRGRRQITCDLKDKACVAQVLALLDGADALIEGYRPGVMERLGFGPDVVLPRNKRLVCIWWSAFSRPCWKRKDRARARSWTARCAMARPH